MRTLSAFMAVMVACVVVASAGCKKGRGDKIVGSCDEPKKPNDPLSGHVCRDFYDARLLKDVCTGINEKLSTTPCDKKGAVAACKEAHYDYWYYDDDPHNTPQSIAGICKSDPVILPTGGTFTPKSQAAVNADNVKDNTAKYGAKAKANLATVATIAKKLPAPTNKVNLEGLAGIPFVVHAEDLGDPEHPKSIPYRLEEGKALSSCSRVMAGHATPKDDGNALFTCAQNVLFVVSVSSFKKPADAGTTQTGNKRTTTYTKGRIAGDVLLFRLDNGKYLGSFGYVAENETIPVFATLEKIEGELYTNFASAISSRATTAAPGLLASVSLAKPF